MQSNVINVFLGFFLVTLSASAFGDYNDNEIEQCYLSNNLIQEIRSYGPVVNKIIREAVSGESRGFVYNELAAFVDKFGNRLAGTLNLENAIDYMLEKLKKLDLDNVHAEEVVVPTWIRGKESATLLQPRVQNLAMLGLGDSVGTPPDGISADAIVVNSFHELDSIGSKVSGKIVVFNEKWVSYGETVKYRDYAAARAAAYGAVATLVRSVTPFSLHSPHTGMQDYSDGVKKIPTACITVEDAHMLRRMYDRGERVVVNIKMEAHRLPNATSRNTVAEIRGGQKPEKVVMVSGHLDSWDVGQGAVDDGGGAFISWTVLALVKKLNLRPRRTLRSVLWTAEEEGLVGALAYAEQHKNETENFNLLMESDEGTFNPLGIEFAGSNDAACIIEEIVKLLEPINATRVSRLKDVGSDITVWSKTNIPRASLLNENEHYFWYHHTDADTMDVQDSDTLDRCLAVWTAVAYVVADLSSDLPRG